MNEEFKFDCGEEQNDGFSCNIVAQETQWYYTEIFPFLFKDDEGKIHAELEFENSEYIDGEITGYYCNTCNVEFTYKEVITMIKEGEE